MNNNNEIGGTLPTESEKLEKIKKYEEFLNERLKKDLDTVLLQRNNTYNEIGEYMRLKSTLEMIKENQIKSTKILANIGSDCFLHVKIPDTNYVFVDVAQGFQVQFTIDEALDFIEVKENYLRENAEKYTEQAVNIQSNIRIVYEGINELMGLPANPPKKMKRFVH
eukprot:TRINITY_DN4035_c0_g1_i1.p1 TRINITY_DN4035_c0_g1~~TRINITY_DN4035_c0_g1_i1.p1  ORF type:complete len:166 (-),score=31.38 TRINITY_DN4035_c0_g1_i1:98-595(-)